MVFMENTLLMMMMSLWPSISGSWRLTATFRRGEFRFWFGDEENVYNVVVNMWKN
jgi:hypothetical protein